MQIKTFFPRTLDRYPLFLNWELDEFVMMMIPFILSFPARQLIVGLIIGIITMQAYINLFKKGKPENYLFHIFWKKGLFNPKGVPPAYISRFTE
jgi:type IV conjugative transfer system protein TraL